jgi:hypothetical protein
LSKQKRKERRIDTSSLKKFPSIFRVAATPQMSEGSFYFLQKVKKYKKSSLPFSFSCVLCVECEKRTEAK